MSGCVIKREGICLDAGKNGQIVILDVVQDGRNAGSNAQPAYGFLVTPPSAIVLAVIEFIWGMSMPSCVLNAIKIVAATELNPKEWDCRTPATGIPIISEEEARATRPDYFLVLPWHFRNEFVLRKTTFRKAGGKLIFPLSQIEVI